MGSFGARLIPAKSGVNFVEYLESNGPQHIDTGFKANSNTRIVIDCEIFTATSFPFGARSASLAKGFDAAVLEHQVFYNFGDVYQFADYANAYERMVIDANKNTATFTGSRTVTITLPTATFTTAHNMVLFSVTEAGSVFTGDYSLRGRVYSCQIYDNGTLIRDMWPCYDRDGVACMYDKVTRAYFYNAGSGEFIAGGRVGGAPVAVTITGTGVDPYAYVVINGTAYTSATSGIEVHAKDVITLAVRGYTTAYAGTVTIDGAVVVNTVEYKAYEWTVPTGIKSITIKLEYEATSYYAYGTITVATQGA